MNLYEDKDTIIHRLRTHISILEQQQNSTGYFSYEDTPSLTEQYSIDTNPKEDAAALEKLLQKREYELDQLREQLNESHQQADEKLHQTNEQLNHLEKQFSAVESERNDLRQQLQHLQDENDLLKSYMNRLPSEIEYEKLRQSYRILEDQLKQSNQTNTDYRKEKTQLKKQLITSQQTIDEQSQRIKSQELSVETSSFNAKCLTIDERNERDQKFDEFTRIIEQLKEKLNEEMLTKKQNQYLNETNIRTVQSLTNETAKKEQTIREITSLLRQNRQELADLRVQLFVSEEEQTRLNERLLTADQLSLALHRVHATIEKLFLVLDFSSEILNSESPFRPDVLMLQLSTHKNKSDSIENLEKVDLSDIDKLECKLDELVDRLLSIRSELIARQFENDLQTTIPCRLQ